MIGQESVIISAQTIIDIYKMVDERRLRLQLLCESPKCFESVDVNDLFDRKIKDIIFCNGFFLKDSFMITLQEYPEIFCRPINNVFLLDRVRPDIIDIDVLEYVVSQILQKNTYFRTLVNFMFRTVQQNEELREQLYRSHVFKQFIEESDNICLLSGKIPRDIQETVVRKQFNTIQTLWSFNLFELDTDLQKNVLCQLLNSTNYESQVLGYESAVGFMSVISNPIIDNYILQACCNNIQDGFRNQTLEEQVSKYVQSGALDISLAPLLLCKGIGGFTLEGI